MIEVPGNTPRPLPGGNLMDVVDATALTAPDLQAVFGRATYVDVTSDPPAPPEFYDSTLALSFDGNTAFDDFITSPGSKGVVFPIEAYNANDPIVGNVNTFESFNLLTQAWIKPDSSAMGSEQIVFQLGTEFGAVTITDDGFWRVNGLGPVGDLTTTAEVAFDQWTHVAVFRTGGSATLYLDGVVAASAGGFFNTFAQIVTLGDGDFTNTPFTGLIDNFSISSASLTGFTSILDVDFFSDNGIVVDLEFPDVNLDGAVDQLDYEIYAANAGSDNGTGIGDISTFLLGDVDQNGKVDFFDFHRIASAAAAAGVSLNLAIGAVPEPAGLALVLIAALALCMSRRAGLIIGVLAVTAVGFPNAVVAEVVVAEDFKYLQTTKGLLDLGGFTTSYGGGQNGSAGVWNERWSAIGGTTIVSDDVANPPLADNPFTAVVTEAATDNALRRNFGYAPAAAGSATIYFAADMKIVDTFVPSVFAELGIASLADDLDTPLVSLGITDDGGNLVPTFFAQLGGSTVMGDFGANANDALVDDTFQRIVGKLEINVGAGPTGDYNQDGTVNAGDYPVWRNSFGDLVPPGTNADGDGNGEIGPGDYNFWQSNFGSPGGGVGPERLTVYFNPTGVETSDATVLTLDADVMTGLTDPALASIVTLNGSEEEGLFGQRPHFIDNVAIGTEWDDVITVNVPRLAMEVDTVSGDINIVNDSGQDIELAYYEILSESGSLRIRWNSLADQNVDGGEWAENNPSTNQLIESNFSDATTLASGGGSLTLNNAFLPSGERDLIARWGVKAGDEGLLNVAEVTYISGAAGAVQIPEPTGIALMALAGGVISCGIRSRRGGSTAKM